MKTHFQKILALLMSFKLLLLPLAFSLAAWTAHALITDPRGTGDATLASLATHLKFWVDASDSSTLFSDASCTTPAVASGSVGCWQDKSGNNAHAIQASGANQPIYTSYDPIFGTPVIDFTSAQTLIADPANWSGAFTVFMVLASDTPAPSDNDAFFSTVDNTSTVGGFQIDYDATNAKFRTKIKRSGAGTPSDAFGPFESNISKLYAVRHSGSGTTPQLYSEGAPVGSGTITGGIFDTVFEQYRLNISRNGVNLHDSRIAEVIVYDKALDTCEMANVNIYLGEKYGRDFAGMSAHFDEFTATHNSAKAGIGVIPSSCSTPIVYDKKTSGEVTFKIDAPYTALHDLDLVNQDEFMTFAHDGAPLAVNTVDLGPYNEQMSRTWRVDLDDSTLNTPSDMSGTAIRNVQVSFDITPLIASGQTVVPTDPTRYALIIDRDNNGNFSNADLVTSGMTLSGNVILFDNVNFRDGNYFALISGVDTNISATVDQGPTQADPTAINNIRYRVVFDAQIDPATFTSADIVLSGTTTGVVGSPVEVANALGNYNGTTFEFVVTGLTSPETIQASLAPLSVSNFSGVPVDGSTSTDNTVSYDATPPVITLSGSTPVTIEVHTTYVDAGALWSDTTDGSGTVTASGTVDIHTVGTYTLTYDKSDSLGNTGTTVTRTINVVDTTPPVITVSGSMTVSMMQHDTYTDAGATCTDNYDVSCSVSVSGSVDTSTIGTYMMTYTATDTQGNTATGITRTITVIDSVSPGVILYGVSPLTVSHSTTESYTDSGAYWVDLIDGSGETLSGNPGDTGSFTVSGSVDRSTLGTYTITYTKIDAAGNTGTISRTIIVADMTPPVVTLSGSSSLTLEAGTPYTELGATWTDIIDGSGTATIAGSVDTSTPGTYTLTYTHTDTAGNVSLPVTRIVVVVDTTAPSTLTVDPISNPSNTGSVIITGNTDTGSSIILLDGSGTVLCTTVASLSGTFTCGPLSPAPLATTVLAVRSCDQATPANCITTPVTLTITIATPEAPTAGPGGGGGGGGSASAGSIGTAGVTPTVPVTAHTPKSPVSSIELSAPPSVDTTHHILPSQTSVTPAGTTKTKDTVYTLTDRVTDIVCPKIVQVYSEGEIRSRDIPQDGFMDDVKAMIMFRGLEQDEETTGQTFITDSDSGLAKNDTSYDGDRSITRAEYVKVLVRALSCRYTYMGNESGFSDVATTAWHAPYITFAKKKGWIDGFEDGTFRPDERITRAQAAKILARAIELTDGSSSNSQFRDVESESLFAPYIQSLADKKILNGKRKYTFDPDGAISRHEVARIVYKTFLGGQR